MQRGLRTLKDGRVDGHFQAGNGPGSVQKLGVQKTFVFLTTAHGQGSGFAATAPGATAQRGGMLATA